MCFASSLFKITGENPTLETQKDASYELYLKKKDLTSNLKLLKNYGLF